MRRSLFVGALVMCAARGLLELAVLAAPTTGWARGSSTSRSPSTARDPGPKSLTLKYEVTTAGIKLTSDGMGTDGKATHGTYTSKFDGKDTPWEGNPDADMAAPKKIDDNSFENVWKKGGKVTVTVKAVVSKDGKSYTVSQTGKNAKGEAVNITAVYDRQ